MINIKPEQFNKQAFASQLFCFSRELNLDGAILNTDEYFVKDGFYEYDINKLSDAHDWNKARGWCYVL